MEEAELSVPPTAAENQQNHAWWNSLTDPWKQAFNEVTLRRSSTEMLDDQTLHNVYRTSVVRFAGPTASYPNMSIELEDFSGITDLKNLKILVVTHHNITSLKEISHMDYLTSLFVFNNKIESLEGIEGLKNLTELYVQGNQISSLMPLEHLSQLINICCNYNKISSLEGITVQHRPNLKMFACIPNDDLWDSEIIRMEREIGIRCVKG